MFRTSEIKVREDLKPIEPAIRFVVNALILVGTGVIFFVIVGSIRSYNARTSFNGRFDAHRASTIIENGLSTHIEDPFVIGHYWTKRTLVGINDPKDNVLSYEFGMKEEGVVGEYVVNDDFANPKTFQVGVPIELGSLHVRHFFFRLRSDQNRLTAPMYLVVTRSE